MARRATPDLQGTVWLSAEELIQPLDAQLTLADCLGVGAELLERDKPIRRAAILEPRKREVLCVMVGKRVSNTLTVQPSIILSEAKNLDTRR